MSTALASARKRRAPASVEPPRPPQITQPSQQQQQQPMQGGLTLPQVISLVDKRLTTLEKFMAESREQTMTSASTIPSGAIPSNLTEVLDEFNNRHELLANEIGSLKNLVMSLQSYTMDVNKMLLQERVKILSELSEDQSVFDNPVSTL
jgi:hypothetical protein